jgi:putative redox protein
MAGAVPSEYPIEVVWTEGEVFRGGRPGMPEMTVDGKAVAGPSPVDALLVALASCSAIDVLEILAKRRTPATAASVSVEFSRAPTPPRRIMDATLNFHVSVDSDVHHVERAIELSIRKYCSVSGTFAPDTKIGWTARVTPADHRPTTTADPSSLRSSG